MNLKELANKSKMASSQLARLTETEKNSAIKIMADYLCGHIETILAANKIDMICGEKNRLSVALLDRLLLTNERIEQIAEGLRAIASLPDPIGDVQDMWKNKDGLQIGKVTVPIGVIAMIYEARPNVTVDASGLCIKSGNAVILRGSSAAYHSNKAIVDVLKKALVKSNISPDAIGFVEDLRHESVDELVTLNGLIDLCIPRGGANLIRSVIEKASVPVIETGVGNCHLYVDQDADINMAMDILINAKVQRPGVCNAIETLLIHNAIVDKFLTSAIQNLHANHVEVRGCKKCRLIESSINEATDLDFKTEYNDLIIAVKIVNGFEEAVEHITEYGSGHSEVIVTENYSTAQKFIKSIDAACVYINASSRFSDGNEFGFGAEIGISTQKIHARGPMGLRALTSYKYVVFGNGQVRM